MPVLAEKSNLKNEIDLFWNIRARQSNGRITIIWPDGLSSKQKGYALACLKEYPVTLEDF